MLQTILLTGATDGIGLATAKKLATQGHHLILHGRNLDKLQTVQKQLLLLAESSKVDIVIADLSDLQDVKKLADNIKKSYNRLDVLINNAGVFKVANAKNANNLDLRFVVNSIAPFYLTTLLSSLLGPTGRVINLSSAAQAKVDHQALLGKVNLEDMQAYAQSKLAIRLWSKGLSIKENYPTLIAVNPGSLLASKMVKEGFGIAGNDISIGADILTKLTTDEDIASHNGEYYDNDLGRYSSDIDLIEEQQMARQVIESTESILQELNLN